MEPYSFVLIYPPDSISIPLSTPTSLSESLSILTSVSISVSISLSIYLHKDGPTLWLGLSGAPLLLPELDCRGDPELEKWDVKTREPEA